MKFRIQDNRGIYESVILDANDETEAIRLAADLMIGNRDDIDEKVWDETVDELIATTTYVVDMGRFTLECPNREAAIDEVRELCHDDAFVEDAIIEHEDDATPSLFGIWLTRGKGDWMAGGDGPGQVAIFTSADYAQLAAEQSDLDAGTYLVRELSPT